MNENHLSAPVEQYFVRGEPAYSGLSPFAFDKSDMSQFFTRPWTIEHADCKGKLFRCTGVESYALRSVTLGSPIALRVVEWDPRLPFGDF